MHGGQRLVIIQPHAIALSLADSAPVHCVAEQDGAQSVVPLSRA